MMKNLLFLMVLLINSQAYAEELSPFPFPPEEVETNSAIVLRLATTYCETAKLYLEQPTQLNPIQAAASELLRKEGKVYNDLCASDGSPKSFLTEPAVNGIYVTYIRLQNSWSKIAKTLVPETELHSKYFYEVRDDLLYSREVISPYSTESEFYKYYAQTLSNIELFDLALSLRRQAIQANEKLRQE